MPGQNRDGCNVGCDHSYTLLHAGQRQPRGGWKWNFTRQSENCRTLTCTSFSWTGATPSAKPDHRSMYLRWSMRILWK